LKRSPQQEDFLEIVARPRRFFALEVNAKIQAQLDLR